MRVLWQSLTLSYFSSQPPGCGTKCCCLQVTPKVSDFSVVGGTQVSSSSWTLLEPGDLVRDCPLLPVLGFLDCQWGGLCECSDYIMPLHDSSIKIRVWSIKQTIWAFLHYLSVVIIAIISRLLKAHGWWLGWLWSQGSPLQLWIRLGRLSPKSLCEGRQRKPGYFWEMPTCYRNKGELTSTEEKLKSDLLEPDRVKSHLSITSWAPFSVSYLTQMR